MNREDFRPGSIYILDCPDTREWYRHKFIFKCLKFTQGRGCVFIIIKKIYGSNYSEDITDGIDKARLEYITEIPEELRHLYE